MPRLRFIWKMIFDGRKAPGPPRYRPEPLNWSAQAITGSCLGHSTVLLNFLGVNVLTDPIFSLRAGPGLSPLILGPRRHMRPALKPREFPPPDVLLLSHAHFDHFDTASLRKFSRDTPVVTAAATGDLLRCLRFREVHELDWEDSVTVNTRHGPLEVKAVEVAHWGARLMRDDHRGYNGYVLSRAGHRVCFAGDTAYTEAFAELDDPANPIDLMMMPIGAYDPWIRAHCSPEQAAQMAALAGARTFVPIHHETFQLSSEPMHEPAARIRAAFSQHPERLLSVHVGQTFQVPLRENAGRRLTES